MTTETVFFDDVYTFNLPALLGGSTLDIRLNDFPIGENYIAGLTGSLWGGVYAGAAVNALNVPNIFNNVAAGNYELHITGNPFPDGQGTDFSTKITVTPVPEPETYALMLGGLALVGFSARRREGKLSA